MPDHPDGAPVTADGPRDVPWSLAMRRASTGEGTAGGFYRRRGAPRATFSTPVTAGAAYAGLVARLLVLVDSELGYPDPLDLVDVGSADGTLTRAVAGELAARGSTGLLDRLRPLDVDLYPDSGVLPEAITGLVVATEWLDTHPVDVVIRDGAGRPRLVVLGASGEVTTGPEPGPGALDWLARWWPLGAEVGSVAEVGSHRDAAWADVVRRVRAGYALATDYGHLRATRPGNPTLRGWSRGRPVPPVPDGSVDVTAAVALDACAAAGRTAGATSELLVDLRTLAAWLGPGPSAPGSGGAGPYPHPALATSDPAGYLEVLGRRGEATLLTAPEAFGGYLVLVQGR